MVHTWAKDNVKYDGHDVEPVHILFFRQCRNRSISFGESNIQRHIKNIIMLYHCKDPKKPRALSLKPAGISAVNISGTTFHSGLGIKPGTKLLGLNNKSKATLRNRLPDVKLLIIDGLSIVSSDLWTDIDSKLKEMFMMIPEIAFAGLSAMSVADLLQLPAVRGKLIFSQFSAKDSMEHLLGLKLWNLFKYAELTEVLRQNDKLFIDLLDKVRVGNIDDDVRFIRESDENYPKEALHMYAENEQAMKRNEIVLNDLLGQLYTIETNSKIPDNYKYTLTLIQESKANKHRRFSKVA